jgi:hypothetical protein
VLECYFASDQVTLIGVARAGTARCGTPYPQLTHAVRFHSPCRINSAKSLSYRSVRGDTRNCQKVRTVQLSDLIA